MFPIELQPVKTLEDSRKMSSVFSKNGQNHYIYSRKKQSKYDILEEQKIWFDNLVKDRETNAKVIEKPSMKGVKKDIVEKYPDFCTF